MQQRDKQALGLSSWLGQLLGACTPECGHRGLGQQTGSHGLGGLVQERTLSRSNAPFLGNLASLVCRESETVALAGGQVYKRIRVSRPLRCRCDSRRLILTA